MTGLNGIRIGWIALNDDKMADIIREMVAAEYCGLSVPSMDILARVLPDYPWDQFEEDSRRSLDANREEFAKLERYFSGSTVPDVGMFFYGLMDKEAKDLFFKADVVWTPGSSLGHNDDWGRFNIGRDYETTKKAVTQVLKADGI
jgi:aspartate/methionine/tyrosine aminotransferase